MALLALNLTAQGADLSGDWTGTIQLSARDEPAFLRLKQEGAAVTGEAGPDAKRLFPIKQASFRNNKLRVETAADSPVVLVFELTLEDEKLSGQVFEDGTRVGPVELKRAVSPPG